MGYRVPDYTTLDENLVSLLDVLQNLGHLDRQQADHLADAIDTAVKNAYEDGVRIGRFAESRHWADEIAAELNRKAERAVACGKTLF